MEEKEANCDPKSENFDIELFQKQMYSIFRDRGLLSGLKTHLRHCMIEALKSTDFGQKLLLNHRSKAISPKYQALNTLIAEYLFHQHYHFTLSVFSSEVPLHSSIPDFIKVVLPFPNTQKENEDTNLKLEDRDVLDILEAFGFSRESKYAENVFQMYKINQSEDNLILCIIRALAPSLRNASEVNRKENDFVQNRQTLIPEPCNCKNLFEELLRSEKEKHLIELQRDMQKVFDYEIQLVQNTEKEKFNEMAREIKLDFDANLQQTIKEMAEKEQNLREKLTKEFELEKKNLEEIYEMRLSLEKNDINSNMIKEKQNLHKVFKNMAEQNKTAVENMIKLEEKNVQLALKKIKLYAEKLKKKEDNLNKRMKDLELRMKNESQIQSMPADKSFTNSPSDDRKIIEKLEMDLEKTKNEIYDVMKSIMKTPESPKHFVATGSQTEGIRHRSVECNTEEQMVLKYNNLWGKDQNQISINKESKEADYKKMIKTLQKENIYLKAFNAQQRKHIQDLIKKQSKMKDEIVRSKSEQNLLYKESPKIKKATSIEKHPKRISSAPSTLKRDKRRGSLRSLVSNTSENSKKYHQHSDYKYLERISQKHKSDEESSFTDEVLREAKKRLQKLEKESEEVEKSFIDFKRRQAENLRLPTKIDIPVKTDFQCKNYYDRYSYSAEPYYPKIDTNRETLLYNTSKRVQNPFMNCDKSYLQNYIQMAQQSYRNNYNTSKMFTNRPIEDKLKQYRRGTVNIMSEDKRFILKPIPNQQVSPKLETKILHTPRTSYSKETNTIRNWMKLQFNNNRVHTFKRYSLSPDLNRSYESIVSSRWSDYYKSIKTPKNDSLSLLKNQLNNQFNKTSGGSNGAVRKKLFNEQDESRKLNTDTVEEKLAEQINLINLDENLLDKPIKKENNSLIVEEHSISSSDNTDELLENKLNIQVEHNSENSTSVDKEDSFEVQKSDEGLQDKNSTGNQILIQIDEEEKLENTNSQPLSVENDRKIEITNSEELVDKKQADETEKSIEKSENISSENSYLKDSFIKSNTEVSVPEVSGHSDNFWND